jgi:hypothetical protein
MTVAPYALPRLGYVVGKLPMALIGCCWLLSGSPILAQTRSAGPVDEPPPVVVDEQAARAPTTNAGTIGQRQTRADVALKTGIEPGGRISNRITNRVQSRLRNRIDRNYDPQANATSPFAIAQDQIQRSQPGR